MQNNVVKPGRQMADDDWAKHQVDERLLIFKWVNNIITNFYIFYHPIFPNPDYTIRMTWSLVRTQLYTSVHTQLLISYIVVTSITNPVSFKYRSKTRQDVCKKA